MKANEQPIDVELVISAQQGSAEAFEILIRRHWKGVSAELMTIVRNQADRDDLIQESFLTAFRRLDTLGPPYSFGAWIRRIARNKARNLLVRRHRFIELDPSGIAGREDRDPERFELETMHRMKCAIHALGSLSPALRETSRLSYLYQFSHQQIADRLKIPLGTVKRRLWDSRQKMKQEVDTMSEGQKLTASAGIVPTIQVRECPGETMEITSRGPGLYFGSVLEIGHVETCRFYDCPGDILTLTVKTRVVRNVRILGRDCVEVLIEHSDCEPPEANLLDYFEATPEHFRWLMRVTADNGYPQTRFMEGDDEFFIRRFRSGEFPDYFARVVDLTIGQCHWGKCLAVWWAWAGGTPVESIYTADGREVLHQRYVAADAPVSSNYDFNQFDPQGARIFKGTEYRLWYQTVLIE